MADACVIAVGAVSAFGLGEQAYDPGASGERARSAICDDAVLAEAGLRRAHCARAPLPANGPRRDRATELLQGALEQLCAQLDQRTLGWRSWRIRIAVGTSSGGMLSAERLFRDRAAAEPSADPAAASYDPAAASYFAPLRRALAAVDLADIEATQVLAACASSTIAIGLGLRWLDRDGCDVVLAGGYDAISVFVAAGFEALRATTATRPQPFRLGRDGMALGEGAGMVALVRRQRVSPQTPALFYVSGFGASADAVHITAPDREARGLLRAARRALADAGCAAEAVQLVSAHGTSTPYNDAAEAKAVTTLCPQQPLVHPFKAQIGHTLGAAGVLEALAAAHALQQQLAPACYGDAPLDPDAQVSLLERAEPRPLEVALKLSAAFGGVTAALLLRRQPSERQPAAPRPVCVTQRARVTSIDKEQLSARIGLPRDRLARIDDVGLLALSAAAELIEQLPSTLPTETGVVVGHALATLDTNERFYKRLLNKGARWVDPRLFPATSPNAAAGHCAIAWGLTGPNFAVGAGLSGGIEALLAAAELVASGDAPAMLVVSVDDAGPAARAWMAEVAPQRELARGAVAVLLQPGSGKGTITLDSAVPHHHGAVGHLALWHWLLSHDEAIP